MEENFSFSSPSLVFRPQLPTWPPALSCPVFPLLPSSLITRSVAAASGGGRPGRNAGAPISSLSFFPCPPFPLLSKGQPQVCAGALMGSPGSPATPATAQAPSPRTSRHTHARSPCSLALPPSLSALQMTLRSRGWWMI